MDNLFKSIIQSCSVPGNEVKLRDLLIDEFKKYGTIRKSKWTGFYCAHHGNKGGNRQKIVITAHMDSPGFIVSNLGDDGTLTVIPLGGISVQTGNLRTVQLHTRSHSYSGIITLNSKGDVKNPSYEGFFGFKDKEELEKANIQLGDSVCFDAPIIELQNDLIMAPHLDNRLGIFILSELAKELKDQELNHDIFYAITSCEETGGRGARILANMIQPDLAICLDVTYESPSAKMGNGAVLTLSDASVLIPPILRDQVTEIAQNNKIPLQYEVYNYAGTDAKDFKDVGDGCITICLLIATKNNHSPHEICSIKDVDHTKKMVLAIINNDKTLIV